MSFGGSRKGFIDDKQFRTEVHERTLAILKDLQERLPSNYIGEDGSPNYAIALKSVAQEAATFLVILEDLYKDIIFTETRGEFINQILGYSAFLDQRFAQTEGSHTEARDFLLAVIGAYLKGSKKTTIEEAVKLATDLNVTITENYLIARANDVTDNVPSKWTFDIDIPISGSGQDITKIQERVKLLIDIIKPAHTLFRTRFIFEDGIKDEELPFKFNCITVVDENGDPILQDGFEVKIKDPRASGINICDADHYDLLLNEYEDIRKECNKRQIYCITEDVTAQSSNRSPNTHLLSYFPDSRDFRLNNGPIVTTSGEIGTLSDVRAFVNGIEVAILEIYPIQAVVRLQVAPSPLDSVEIEYCYATTQKLPMTLNNPYLPLNGTKPFKNNPLNYTTVLYDFNEFTYADPLEIEYDYSAFSVRTSSLLNTPQNLVYNGAYLSSITIAQNFLIDETTNLILDGFPFIFKNSPSKIYEIGIGSNSNETVTNIKNTVDNLASPNNTDYYLEVIDVSELSAQTFLNINGTKYYFTKTNYEIDITDNLELFEDASIFLDKEFLPFVPNNVNIQIANNILLNDSSTLTINNQTYSFTTIPAFGKITIGSSNSDTANNVFNFLLGLAIFDLSYNLGSDTVTVNKANAETNVPVAIDLQNFSDGVGIQVGQDGLTTLQNIKDYLDANTSIESEIISDKLLVRESLPRFTGNGISVQKTDPTDRIIIDTPVKTAENISTFLQSKGFSTDYVTGAEAVYFYQTIVSSNRRAIKTYSLTEKIRQFNKRNLQTFVNQSTLILRDSENRRCNLISNNEELAISYEIQKKLRNRLNDFQYFKSFGQEVGSHVVKLNEGTPLFAETYTIEQPFNYSPDDQFELNEDTDLLNNDKKLFDLDIHRQRDPYPFLYKQLKVEEFPNEGVENLISPICETAMDLEFGSLVEQIDPSGNPTGEFIRIGAFEENYDIEDIKDILYLPDIEMFNSWLKNQHLSYPLTSFEGLYAGLGPGSGVIYDPTLSPSKDHLVTIVSNVLDGKYITVNHQTYFFNSTPTEGQITIGLNTGETASNLYEFLKEIGLRVILSFNTVEIRRSVIEVNTSNLIFTEIPKNIELAYKQLAGLKMELDDFTEEETNEVTDELTDIDITILERESKYPVCFKLADFDGAGGVVEPDHVLLVPTPSVDPDTIPEKSFCLPGWLTEKLFMEIEQELSEEVKEVFDELIVGQGLSGGTEIVPETIEDLLPLEFVMTVPEENNEVTEEIIITHNILENEIVEETSEEITELEYNITEDEIFFEKTDDVSITQNLFLSDSFKRSFILNADKAEGFVNSVADLPDAGVHIYEIWGVRLDILTTQYYRSNGVIWEVFNDRCIDLGTLNEDEAGKLNIRTNPIEDQLIQFEFNPPI